MAARAEGIVIQRKFLDELMTNLKTFILPDPPEIGWLRTIRQALFMPQDYLAKKLNVRISTISRFEEAEQKKTISLATLEKMAEALDCELKYILIPKKPLEDTLKQQLLTQLEKRRKRVDSTMALEGQKVETEKQNIESLLLELALTGNVNGIKLWGDQ